jgi:enamine deaminase RidA (YjgF/YER057c/UK114 family)
MQPTRYSTGTKWEPIVGYSRAVRAGNRIWISGTTATDENGTVVGPGNPYIQTIQSIKNIETALKALGANLSHVTRTRIYVTDITQWELVGKAHGEYFGEIRPATSMVEVRRLISPEMMVEMEADAFIPDSSGGMTK